MLLDYRGNPIPRTPLGFAPSAPVAPRPTDAKPAADAVGFTVDCESYYPLEECVKE